MFLDFTYDIVKYIIYNFLKWFSFKCALKKKLEHAYPNVLSILFNEKLL